MAILYAFDEHKNKVAFDSGADITVPMQLPDGSILLYDRGDEYGKYITNFNGYPKRLDGAVDDGSAESTYWRYLICSQKDLSTSYTHQWGPDTSEGLTNRTIGAGLPNTNAMIAKYDDNTLYWWRFIKDKREDAGLDWFMPSDMELQMMYDNRTVITGQGGDAFRTDNNYWSSSETSSSGAWSHEFSTNSRSNSSKTRSCYCRLLRRI